MSNPRASTDEEDAPLLDSGNEAQPHQSSSFTDSPIFDRLKSLSPLEKILAVLVLILLLIASIFIGLFAGTAHRLDKIRHQPAPTETVTNTIYPYPTGTATYPGDGKPLPTPTRKPHNEHKTCLTRDCVTLASDILHGLDEDIDPCDNFYLFANQGWMKAHSIPADRGGFGTFNELQDKNRKVILDVLEGTSTLPVDKKNVSDAEKEAAKKNLEMLKRGYQSCMDEDKVNSVGIEPLMPLVNTLIDLLGPFNVPGSYGVQDSLNDPDDFEGTFDDDSYRIPEHLRIDDVVDVYGSKRGKKHASPLTDAGKTEYTKSSTRTSNIPSFAPNKKRALTEALSFAHSRGVDALLGFEIEGDAGGPDPQVQGLFFYQTMGGLPAKDYYEEAPIVDVYTQVISQILYALSNTSQDKANGPIFPWPSMPSKGLPFPPAESREDREKNRIYELAKRVVKFERALWRAGTDPEFLANPKYAYNPFSFKQLEDTLPFMSLSSYLASFAPRNFPEKIIVTYPPYLESVSDILKDTPDHIVSAYFVTRMAITYSTSLGPETSIRKATRRLQEVLSGIKKGTPEDRQVKCQTWVDSVDGLGLIGGAEFVSRTFGGSSKEQAEEVIYNIIDAFKRRLKTLSWMDKKSAAAAAEKADNMFVKIGYPTTPDVTSPISLRNWYSRLKIGDDFFANTLEIRQWAVGRTTGTLGKVRDRGTWLMEPQLVNAYYSPPDSEIVFPAGILQPPFFHADYPLWMQYGAFGAVAAHELGHAFDNSGSQYDAHGRLRDWWTNSTVAKFNEKAQCVAKTYSRYTIPGPDGKPVHINGNLTNGEDLGDAAITFAYDAWKKVMEKKGEDIREKMPGLNYTQEQLFFISSSRVWAQLIKPESALARIRSDPHSPNVHRSNGQLAGFPTFSEQWKCSEGSKLNPSKRCNVWN